MKRNESFIYTKTQNAQLASEIAKRGIININELKSVLDNCNRSNGNLGQALIQKKMLSTQNLAQLLNLMNTNGKVNTQVSNITKNFGKYVIIEELARGGMGVVYKAFQVDIKRTLVLKTLLPSMANDDISVKRFLKEAKTMSLLKHPNIVLVYDYGKENNIPYFTMQYIEGMDFQALIDKKETPSKILLEIIENIARALHYAHENKIIHRDIKPANILLDKNNKPYLADFGLAKWQDKSSSLTQSGAVVGTPFFLSPEQVRGHRRGIDKRTDIYSLGIILYNTITNAFPYESTDIVTLYRKILKEVPISPKKHNPEISNILNFICLKSIDKNVEHRYQTAFEFAEALRNFRENNTKGAYRESFLFSAKNCWRNYKKTIVIAIAIIFTLCIAIVGLQYFIFLEKSLIIKNEKKYYQMIDLIKKAEYEKAFKDVNLFLKKNSNAVRFLILKGQIVNRWHNDHKSAERCFDKALKLAPNNCEVLYESSLFYLKLKKYKGALQLIDKAIQKNDNISLYYRCRAKIYKKMKRDKLSKKNINIANNIENKKIANDLRKLEIYKTTGKKGKVLLLLNEIIVSHPNSEIAHKERALLYYERKEYAYALQDIAKVVLLNPSMKNYSLQANWFLKLGEEEKALDSYMSIPRAEITSTVCEKILTLQIETKKYSRVIKTYQNISFKTTFTKLQLSKAYYYTDAFEKAWEVIKQISPEDKFKGELSFYKSAILYHLEKYALVEKTIKKIYNFNYKIREKNKIFLQYFLASILVKKKKYDQAIVLLQKTLEKVPDFAELNFLLAECYQNKKNYKKALDYYSRCILFQPWKSEYYEKRGNVYIALKKWAPATFDFFKSLDLKNNNVNLISNIFLCGYNENVPFRAFITQKILQGKIRSIYDNLKSDLFEKRKRLLGNLFLRSEVNIKKTTKNEIVLAQKFIKILTQETSLDVKNMAEYALEGLSHNEEIYKLLKLELKKINLSNELKTSLTDLHSKVYAKYLEQQKKQIQQLLVRYYIVQDKNALIDLYAKKTYSVDVLEQIFFDPKIDIILRFFSAETLAKFRMRRAIKILKKAELNGNKTISFIAKTILVKYKQKSKNTVSLKNTTEIPAFLKTQLIQNNVLIKPEIEKMLDDKNIKVRLTAAENLWQQGEEIAEEVLIQSIKSKNLLIKSFALDVFWTLKKHDLKYRENCIKKYLSSLIEYTDFPSVSIQRLAISKMKYLKTKETFEKLKQKLNDKNNDVRAQAISIFSSWKEIDPIMKIATNPKENITMRLAPFMYFDAKGGSPQQHAPVFQVAAVLDKLLKDSSYHMRFIVIGYMMRVTKSKGIINFALSKINLKNRHDRFAMAVGLLRGSPYMLEFLKKMVVNDKYLRNKTAAAASIFGILINNGMNQESFLKFIKKQSKKTQQGASFGYSSHLYDLYYRPSKVSSRIINSLNNSDYEAYLFRLEKIFSEGTQKKKDMILKCTQEALELDLKNVRCRLERGVALYLSKKYDESLKTLKEIKELKNNPIYLYWLAKLYFAFDKNKQAQKIIIKATSMQPWNKNYVNLHAEIEERLGNKEVYDRLIDRLQLLE